MVYDVNSSPGLKPSRISGTMFFRVLRGALVLATASLIVPYTVAILGNVLYGWPQGKKKYKRALSPRKVFGVNYVIFQMLKDRSKFITLYFKWRQFYKTADPRFLYKNIAYGRNDCTLDVYLGEERTQPERREGKPVVIFVYGGAWSSGDKSSYGLLCSNIVKNSDTVVVCPNYSTYPKGYVDDMVQDIVDCICWVIENIDSYGGDKNKVVLLGHSAGAHLAALALLELLHDERTNSSVGPAFRFINPPCSQGGGLSFSDAHYGRASALDRARDGLGDSSGSSESFAVVSDNGAMAESGMSGGSLESSGAAGMLGSSGGSGQLQASANSEGFVSLSTSGVMLEVTGEGETQGEEGEVQPQQQTSAAPLLQSSGDGEGAVMEELVEEGGNGNSQPRSNSGSGSLGDDEEEPEEDSGDNDSVVTVRPKDIDRHTTLVDMVKSVKAFIGLAGVYSIGDHYEHESSRGIEDMSNMCRAHYGQDHFQRFSPKEIVRSLGRSLSLPLMVLVHGQADYITPMTSTLSFGEALADIMANVKVKVIPECPHYEVCLDLMDRHRRFYPHVMDIVLETVKSLS